MDYEDIIKNMFYDWDNERKILNKIQKCQRNWDYDKWNDREISPVMLDELLYIAQNSPSKQHEGYFDVYYSTDRETIEEMSKYTWGYTHRRNPPATWRNSQSNASAYMLWYGCRIW